MLSDATITTAMGGVIGMLAAWLGARLAAKYRRVEHDGDATMSAAVARHVELLTRLSTIDGSIADLRERVAGVEAVIRYVEPALGEPPRRRRSDRAG